MRLLGRRELSVALDKIICEGLNVSESEAAVDFLLDGDAENRISGKTRLERIESFKNSIKRSVDNLVSLGIDAKRSVGFYENKIYITVSIDERDI